MHALPRKTNTELGQCRFYALTVTRTLFSEWVLLREWGRYGYDGGQAMVEYFDAERDAKRAFQRLRARKIRRGYLVQGQGETLAQRQ